MALYRTFVQLDLKEKEILHKIGIFMTKPGKRPPAQSAVIRAIIREYWDVLRVARAQEEEST